MKLYSLYIAAIFVFIAVFGIRPLTSLYASSLDATMFQISLITMCYSVGPLLIAIKIGRFIDQYGEKIPILIGALGIGISAMLPVLVQSIGMLFLSQFLLGTSQILTIVALQNGVASAVSSSNRDRAVGTFSLFTSTGMFIGPFVGGFTTDYFGFLMAFIVLACAPIVSFLVTLGIQATKKRETKKAKDNNLAVTQLIGQVHLRKTIIVGMLVLSALDLFYVYFPLYAESIGFTASQIGILLGVMAGANMLARVFIGKLITLFGRVNTLWLFMLIGAVGYACVTFTSSFAALFLIVFIIGAGLGVTQPLTIILTYNLAPINQTGEVLGIRLAANRLSQTILPFLFANLSTLIGLGSIFIFKALLLGIGCLSAKGIQEKQATIQKEVHDVK